MGTEIYSLWEIPEVFTSVADATLCLRVLHSIVMSPLPLFFRFDGMICHVEVSSNSMADLREDLGF